MSRSRAAGRDYLLCCPSSSGLRGNRRRSPSISRSEKDGLIQKAKSFWKQKRNSIRSTGGNNTSACRGNKPSAIALGGTNKMGQKRNPTARVPKPSRLGPDGIWRDLRCLRAGAGAAVSPGAGEQQGRTCPRGGLLLRLDQATRAVVVANQVSAETNRLVLTCGQRCKEPGGP